MAAFRVENYGDSELARRFGVTRYPAIFVGDVLVATPKDFGFYGEGEGGGQGRYAPLLSAASHERFRGDLRRVIELVAGGRSDEARAVAAPAADPAGAVTLPARLAGETVDGRRFDRTSFVGKVVVVEHWATWCPPCRGSLAWLTELQRRHPDDLAVVAVAMESDPDDVKTMAAEIGPGLLWTLATDDLRRALGDPGAVPALTLFDREGRLVGDYLGAAPGLREEVEAELARLLAPRPAGP